MVTTRAGTATEAIARFITRMRYDIIPQAAVDVVRRTVLDCIGITLGGRAAPEGRIIIDYVKESGGPPEAVVFGAGFRAPAAQAALANGTMAAALDYGDTSLTWGVGHPSQSTLPAVLALGEKVQASGKQVIEAYITGFEVGSRIGSALNRHYDLGWHTTATIGTLAGAAACARLLNLDVTRTRMALGIAGSSVSGLKRQFGSMMASFHSGKASRDAVVAASLAQKGFTAHDNIMEGDNGVAHLFTGGDFDAERLRQTSDGRFDILSPGGVYIKAYPCCHLTQWCLGAMYHLKREQGIRFEDVAGIVCRIPSFFFTTLTSEPKTGWDARRSLEYCLAVLLLDGEIKTEAFTDELLARPAVQAFMRNVKLVPISGAVTVAESLKQPETMVVTLKDGTEHVREVSYPRGDTLRDPMTDRELEAKFRECARATLSRERTERVLEQAWKLEALPRITDLTGLCL
ncbi:MAG: MmgE/PrpD family protein [Chloroflexi bacterium]|nr:MmgE/PrpD family protein [Chloroflexota bacterium]